MPTKVFLLGATGYIGGSVLQGVREAYPELEVTALVRKEQDIPAVEATGVRVVKGSHEDLPQIQALSREANIVLNCADADDLPLTKAILEGARIRASSGQRNSILLHTSGTSVVADEPTGEFTPYGRKIWNDNSEEDIKSIPPEQPHRLIDLEIFHADGEGYLSAYIITPSTIYGPGTGPCNKISDQIPRLTEVMVRRSQVVHIGKGTNKWMNVHIADLTDLYLLVLKHALSDSDKGSPYAKFHFGSVHEYVWGDVARQIGQVLYEEKLVPSPVPKSIAFKEEPSLGFTATNSRTASDRGFKLGWNPHRKPLDECVEDDVKATLRKLGKI